MGDILSYQSWQISLTKRADKILISPRTARQGKEELGEEISRRWWQEFAGGFTAFSLYRVNMNRNPKAILKFQWQHHLPAHPFPSQCSPTANQMTQSLCHSHDYWKTAWESCITIWVLLWYKTILGIYSLVLRVLWGAQLLFLQRKLRNVSILGCKITVIYFPRFSFFSKMDKKAHSFLTEASSTQGFFLICKIKSSLKI